MAIALILPIWRVKLRIRLWGYAVGFPGLEEEHKNDLPNDPRVSFGSQRDVMMGVRFPSCPPQAVKLDYLAGKKGKQTRD